MEIQRLNVIRGFSELFIIKSSDNSSPHDYIHNIRLKFIEIAKKSEQHSNAFLNNYNDSYSISGDIIVEHDLKDGSILVYLWPERFDNFPELKNQLLKLFQ